MKNILTIASLVCFLSCKAQIIPYEGAGDIYVPDSGFYYKDTNNFFNTFTGAWKWEDVSANSSLTFVFDKTENLDSGENFFYDLLIGEYQYIENGVELANTLQDINNPNVIGENHKISGVGIITKYNLPLCPDCDENEKRLEISIKHDNYDKVQGWLVLRHVTENGVEKLHVTIYDGPWLSEDNNAPEDIDIPFGAYILIKQN